MKDRTPALPPDPIPPQHPGWVAFDELAKVRASAVQVLSDTILRAALTSEAFGEAPMEQIHAAIAAHAAVLEAGAGAIFALAADMGLYGATGGDDPK